VLLPPQSLLFVPPLECVGYFGKNLNSHGLRIRILNQAGLWY